MNQAVPHIVDPELLVEFADELEKIRVIRKKLARISLENQDYLSPEQAAEYATRGKDSFRSMARKYGIPRQYIDGKLMYRKLDIRRTIEKLWLDSERARNAGT